MLNVTKKVPEILLLHLAFILLAVLLYTPRGFSGVREIKLTEAVKMAENVKDKIEFPLDVNDSVLKEINHYLCTQDGKEYMRKALGRMMIHKRYIETKINYYGIPKAVLAIPVIESGYQNLPQTDKRIGAGIWQFIKPTANNFGLKVDENTDERLDVKAETDAAIRYLLSSYYRFNDWRLAILAYNAGGGTVQKGINKTGSRDPWRIIKAGFENDKNYLSKVVAAIIIMHNQSELEF